MRYNNYHKHTHYSNISTPDCIVKPQHYIERALELGHTAYFTTEHRYGGNPWEAYDLCKENNLKMIYGVEAYFTDDRRSKDRNNFHIILIAKNISGYKQINKIMSESNISGFYYRNRIDLELLLSLNPKDVIITTACVSSRLFKTENYEQDFLIPVLNHFNDSLYLEVQSHPHPVQAEFNEKILELHNKYKIPIIHANDSHYILPEHAKDRDDLLRGKGIFYEEEDGFILDYPNSNTIFERYEKQGVLTKEKAKQAVANTLIFDECEDLGFTKDIKMPTIYKDFNIEEKHKELKKIINNEWIKSRENIDKKEYDKYIKNIREEVEIIEETSPARTVDYFLLNYEIIKRGKEKGGVLSKTGRGSSPSFYTNNLLGFTEIDRINSPIPLYPTRFMSKARILETMSLPDIDFNTSNIEPFVEASKEILGYDGVYFMIAYGTMQESEAFRNLCRSKGMNINDYNDIAKNIDLYKNDDYWGKIIEESKKFIGVIDSVSPSPCSFLLLDKPISEEIGLLKVGNEICCCIDGYTADKWKYLKNDYLTVTVWDIIAKTFELIGVPIPNIKELTEKLDNKVWSLYKNGLTATLNQADTDFSMALVKKYKPKSVAEMAAFVAAIRPGFASLLDIFLKREEYSTGIKELDELLSDSFKFMLYQESIMKFLIWCGIPEDETYDILKKIAKKKFKEKELKELKSKLLKEFINKTGSEFGFNDTWQVIEDAASYSFNASHALSYAYDSLYGAYLKANYPLEYFTVVLNTYASNTDKTDKIVSELPYFNIKIIPIKFRKSKAEYSMDKKNNNIVKGIASIKFCNEKIAEELFNLGKNNYNSFLDLLIDIKEISVRSDQLNILTKLNFFSEFGNNKKLLDYIDIFNKYYGKKQFNKDKMDSQLEDVIKLYCNKETPKQYREFDSYKFLRYMWKQIPNEILPLNEQLDAEKEYLGYCQTTIPESKYDLGYVLEVNTKYTPRLLIYDITDGSTQWYKIKKSIYNKSLIEESDIIYIAKTEQKNKMRKIDNQWVRLDELEWHITDYIKTDPNKLTDYITNL